MTVLLEYFTDCSIRVSRSLGEGLCTPLQNQPLQCRFSYICAHSAFVNKYTENILALTLLAMLTISIGVS